MLNWNILFTYTHTHTHTHRGNYVLYYIGKLYLNCVFEISTILYYIILYYIILYTEIVKKIICTEI